MPPGVWCLAALIVLIGPVATAGEEASTAITEKPRLILDTTAGEIVIELDPAAAPNAVGWITHLAEDPTLNPPPGSTDSSYWSGLEFDYTHPRIEITTSAHPPVDSLTIANEIDAGALGLDRRRVADVHEAIDLIQFELAPAHNRLKRGDDMSDDLASWIEQWAATNDASFLIGIPYRRVYEALGYTFCDGLSSLPVKRGTVALKPLRQNHASPRLSIALADLPQRTGKWMVVGRVVSGLETADEISVRPLLGVGTPMAKQRKPAVPVVITSAAIEHFADEGPPSTDSNQPGRTS